MQSKQYNRMYYKKQSCTSLYPLKYIQRIKERLGDEGGSGSTNTPFCCCCRYSFNKEYLGLLNGYRLFSPAAAPVFCSHYYYYYHYGCVLFYYPYCALLYWYCYTCLQYLIEYTTTMNNHNFICPLLAQRIPMVVSCSPAHCTTWVQQQSSSAE